MATTKPRASAPRPGAATKAVKKPGDSATKAEAKKPEAKKPEAKKPPRIRGTFVMPAVDYALIAKLKLRARRDGTKVKKSELFRLGLQALDAMPALELQDRILALQVPAKRSKT